MVDISAKAASERIARAIARVRMQSTTLDAIFGGGVAKGDVLAVARVAGIQGAKRTSELIPLCHPLALTKVTVDFARDAADVLQISTECKVTGQTGVEMEALTAASVALHVAGGQGSIHSITLAMVLMASVSSPNCRWLAQPG